MKKKVISALSLIGLYLPGASATDAVEFDWFRYDTPPALYEVAESQFKNPVLPGYYPDPSITRKGDDYYLVNSSFSYTPGLPVFHSKNLTDWKLVGYALDRAS